MASNSGVVGRSGRSAPACAGGGSSGKRPGAHKQVGLCAWAAHPLHAAGLAGGTHGAAACMTLRRRGPCPPQALAPDASGDAAPELAAAWQAAARPWAGGYLDASFTLEVRAPCMASLACATMHAAAHARDSPRCSLGAPLRVAGAAHAAPQCGGQAPACVPDAPSALVPCTPPPHSHSQDEAATAAAEGLLSCVAVLDASQPGAPLLHAAAGFEALSGYTSAQLAGRACAQVRRRHSGTHRPRRSPVSQRPGVPSPC